MKKVLLFAAAAAIGFFACDMGEKVFEQTQTKEKVELTQSEMDVLYSMRNGESNQVTLDEATKIANEVIGFLDAETATKSGNTRSIASTTALLSENEGEEKTKSGNAVVRGVEMPDTIAYIFNFEDGGGFTIIAADTRISPILCFTGTGMLDETNDNPGVDIFLEGMGYYIERSIVEAEAAKDSLLLDIMAKLMETGVSDTTNAATDSRTKDPIKLPFLPDDIVIVSINTTYSYGSWSIDVRIGPLLTVEWAQGEPYSELVKFYNCSSGVAPTGCVITATSQLMSYWSHPASIDSYIFNWSLIRQYTWTPNRYDGVGSKDIHLTNTTTEANLVREQVARLMERIGFHIDAEYSCGETGAVSQYAVNFLKNRGYSGGTKENYSQTPVINSLNSNRPVFARGNCYKTTIGNTITYSGGHAWIMDGYLRRKRSVTATTTMTYYDMLINGLPGPLITTTTTSSFIEYSPYYLHNNWGWNSYANGFYSAGCFDTNSGPHLHSNTKTVGNEGDFQYNNEIFPNIYK